MSLGGYAILFIGVAVAWVGIPLVGGAVLAAAGVMAGDGQLNVWVAVGVATVAACVGGYIGYVLGARAAHALAGRAGRWESQRRRAMAAGERFYRRWGPVAVFLTPTYVSGALRMPRRSFLVWNTAAAATSSLITVFGTYAIARAVLGQLSDWRALIAIAVAVLGLATVSVLWWRRAASPRSP